MSDLAKRLAMPHLSKTDEEVRADLEEALAQKPEEKSEERADPRDKPVYTFSFKYTNRRGKVYSATFTNHILNIQDQQAMGAYEATMTGGTPVEAIAEDIRALNRAISWMTFSLKKRAHQIPKGWADNFRALDDRDLILAVFQEVDAHQGIFHGFGKDPIEGEEEAGDAEGDA